MRRGLVPGIGCVATLVAAAISSTHAVAGGPPGGTYTVWGLEQQSHPAHHTIRPHRILLMPQFKYLPKHNLPNLAPNSDKNPLFAYAEVSTKQH